MRVIVQIDEYTLAERMGITPEQVREDFPKILEASLLPLRELTTVGVEEWRD